MEFKGTIMELASKSTASMEAHVSAIARELEKFIEGSVRGALYVRVSHFAVQITGRQLAGTLTWGDIDDMFIVLDLDNRAELTVWPSMNHGDTPLGTFDLTSDKVGCKLSEFYHDNLGPKVDKRYGWYERIDREAAEVIREAARKFGQILDHYNASLVYDDMAQWFRVVPNGVRVIVPEGDDDDKIFDESKFPHIDLPLTGGIFLDDQVLAMPEDDEE